MLRNSIFNLIIILIFHYKCFTVFKDIFEVYKLLNIPTESNKNINNFEKVAKYDYNQRSSLDINTYAKI